jgi:hypothetical protein
MNIRCENVDRGLYVIRSDSSELALMVEALKTQFLELSARLSQDRLMRENKQASPFNEAEIRADMKHIQGLLHDIGMVCRGGH